MDDKNWIALADVIVTALTAITIAGIGWYLAHNIRRQINLRVAERRMDAYAKLWNEMRVASPTRIAKWNPTPNPLSSYERQMLFDAFVNWYYTDGNGMLLGDRTRTMYLEVKDNLMRPPAKVNPPKLGQYLDTLSGVALEQKRGTHSIRQISLLRTCMRADLAVFGRDYMGSLDNDDWAFLDWCKEDLSAPPWTAPVPTFWQKLVGGHQ